MMHNKTPALCFQIIGMLSPSLQFDCQSKVKADAFVIFLSFFSVILFIHAMSSMSCPVGFKLRV